MGIQNFGLKVLYTEDAAFISVPNCISSYSEDITQISNTWTEITEQATCLYYISLIFVFKLDKLVSVPRPGNIWYSSRRGSCHA